MLFVPGLQFRGLPALDHWDDAPQPEVRILAKPGREPMREEDGDIIPLEPSLAGDDPNPTAHVMRTDVEIA
jgi:hypothetical protein